LGRRDSATLVAIVLTLAGLFGAMRLRASSPVPSGGVDLEAISRGVGSFVSRDLDIPEDILNTLRSDEVLFREYRSSEGGEPVWLFVDYHASQKVGSQIHSPRHCYPGSGWTILTTSVEAFEQGERARLVLLRDKREMVTQYWYETRWGRCGRETDLKLALLRSALAGRSTDAALVRLSTRVGDGEASEDAWDRLSVLSGMLDESLAVSLPFEERQGG
jgi:EpsI family protein